MVKMKCALVAFVCFCCVVVSAQQISMPVSNGEVIYKHTIKLNSTISDDDAFTMMQEWFNANTAEFNQKNESYDGENAKLKTKKTLDEAFDNSRPIQSIDPYARKIAVRGQIKYHGGENTCIHLLYVQYYMVAEISDHHLTITVNQMKYHHFNARMFILERIYNWQGGKPADAENNLIHLLDKVYIPELDKLSSYMNHTVYGTIGKIKKQFSGENQVAEAQ